MYYKVCSLLGNQFGVRYNKISLDAVLSRDLGLDSLDTIELTQRLEAEFGVYLYDLIFKEMTVAQLTLTVENQLLSASE